MMTATRAARFFAAADHCDQITPLTINQSHLDLLQMSDIDIDTRAALGEASDALAARKRGAPVLWIVCGQFNARVMRACEMRAERGAAAASVRG